MEVKEVGDVIEVKDVKDVKEVKKVKEVNGCVDILSANCQYLSSAPTANGCHSEERLALSAEGGQAATKNLSGNLTPIAPRTAGCQHSQF